MECARPRCRDIVADPHLGSLGPVRDAEVQWKADWAIDANRETQISAKRIIGIEVDLNGHVLNVGSHCAWRIGNSGKTAIRGVHPKVSGKLGPALRQVCRAAPEVRLQS